MRYVLLSLLVILIAFVIHRLLRVGWKNWRILLVLFAIMLLLMLIFDSYLTGLPIVEYNKSLVLGMYIGPIPIEDFGYLIAVVIAGPALFDYFSKDETTRKK